MSTYEDRKSGSLGPDRLLYCRVCMCEREVYSAQGHKPNQMLLHCVNCGVFVSAMKHDLIAHNWELDYDEIDSRRSNKENLK